MISIVVCSVKPTQYTSFCQSVATTIGVPYEIIQIDNSKNEYNICQAYNKGKTLAKYELVCFSHEDIVFRTEHWGQLLLNILKDPTIGMVGVMGICYLSLFPTDFLDQQELEGQVVVGALEGAPTHYHTRFPSKHIADVVGVDGMFMATRKDVIKQYDFPGELLKGFHGYDVDVNMHIRQRYRIVVARELLLHHQSGGHYNEAYFEAMRLLAIKWKQQLPAYIPAYSNKEIAQLKLRSLREYAKRMRNKGSKLDKLRIAFQYAKQQKVLLPWTSHQLFARAGA